MTASTQTLAEVDACCSTTADECFALRDDCCARCTHYEPIGPDIDRIAVERACEGDRSVPLNRDEFAEAHRLLHEQGKSSAQIADVLGTTARSVDRWNNGHATPYSRRPGGRAMNMTTTTESATDALLRRAAQSESTRIRRAAERVTEALDRLRAEFAEDESKREARERVERLERELREAKAALRGGTVTRATPAAGSAPRTGGRLLGEFPCTKCGRICTTAAGRSAHERNCTHVAVVSDESQGAVA